MSEELRKEYEAECETLLESNRVSYLVWLEGKKDELKAEEFLNTKTKQKKNIVCTREEAIRFAEEYAKAKTEEKQKVLNECASMLSEYMQKNTVLHDEKKELQKEVETREKEGLRMHREIAAWKESYNDLKEHIRSLTETGSDLIAENEALKECLTALTKDSLSEKIEARIRAKELLKTKEQ